VSGAESYLQSMPRFILIDPTVRPQDTTNVTDRTGQTTVR